MSDQAKVNPFTESPLLHKSDHDLSQRIESVCVLGDEGTPQMYTVGHGGVVRIWQTAPAIAGQVWMVDIETSYGSVWRRFNPIGIDYAKEQGPEMVVDLGEKAR